MRLLSLEVANYRNIAAAQLEPGRELTVICGNNGQGKTNLLEAIWLLTGGKSFRGGKDAELVRRGETFAVLEAVTQRTRQEDQEPDEPANVRITVGTPDAQRPGRYASVNGSPPKRAAGLAGSFPAVVFDPGHLSQIPAIPVSGGSAQTRPSAAFRCAAAYCRLPTLYPHAPPYNGSGSSGSPAYSVFAASSLCRTALRCTGEDIVRLPANAPPAVHRGWRIPM